MKKYKWWILGAVAVVAVLSIILVIAFMSDNSLSQESSSQESSGQESLGFELSVKDAQLIIDDELKNVFLESAENSYELIALKKAATISVLTTSVDGDTAIATCSVKSIDIRSALMALLDSIGDQKITKAIYEEKVKYAVDSAKTTEDEVELTFTLSEDGVWFLDEISYEVYDLYLGGYLTFTQDIITKMGDMFDE